MATQIWEICLTAFAVFVGSFAPVMIKKGLNQITKMRISSLITSKYVISGIIIYGAAFILYIPALKSGDLSILYPIASSSYIWASLLSVKMLGEKMNPVKWCGILIIIFGVVLIGWGR
jgi:uncharacterized membrane protein